METIPGLSEVQHEQLDDITDLICDEGPGLEVESSEQGLKESLFSKEDLKKQMQYLKR